MKYYIEIGFQSRFNVHSFKKSALHMVTGAEPCECDLNTDGICDMQDWLVFGQDWGRTDCNDPGVEECECDITEDGICDMQDWLVFGQDWGRTDCPVPP